MICVKVAIENLIIRESGNGSQIPVGVGPIEGSFFKKLTFLSGLLTMQQKSQSSRVSNYLFQMKGLPGLHLRLINAPSFMSQSRGTTNSPLPNTDV